METANKKEHRPVRVGVVGVGYLGKFHADKYAAMPGVRLVGLADVDEGRCRGLGSEYGVLSCTDYRDLLDKVDAVSIVVPTSEHHRIAKEFLMHGKDVLVEKPITQSLEEADELIRIAHETDRIIQVGHLEHFNPAVVALKEKLSRPMFIESHRLGTFKERGTDLDVVTDLMIHDVDIILGCVNSPVTNIEAVGVPVLSPRVDIANARISFANGCVANITASRISMKSLRKIRIFQPNAYLTVDFADRELAVILRSQGSPEQGGPQISGNTVRYTDSDPLADELKAFVECVRTRKPPLVDGHKGRNALEVCIRIMEAISERLAAAAASMTETGEPG